MKTLEEPPKHVIFILATTELHKVPETIISRCQVFTFKKASDLVCKKMLIDVAKGEGFELDGDSAELLAILADGSFRDGLGELQKVLNFIGKDKKGKKVSKVTREGVESITGAPKTTLVNDFISAIAERNLEKGISTVRSASTLNLDMKLYLKLIINKFRMAIILKSAPGLEDKMVGDLSKTDIDFLKILIKKDLPGKAGMFHSLSLSTLLEAYQNIENTFIAELPLELALVKIIAKEVDISNK
ncbi:MAG: polymerase III gamma and tau subunit protein [Candidatus Nomurabacteria bacterium GW2011_GWC2_35_8]|uniref:Polymerase III gamma and tau subunit protein n=1 Tax=Candidatus Nomurabacteria bacterium GW2011_GWC2_35_8 TaxID=1618752 RepID=A0A0G0GAV5_9BACT|nr:MAG: polymerase III gamma and tau subunit protein [Candidatus Nomurabacteria bacterium GW2011_GWC2_35_8]